MQSRTRKSKIRRPSTIVLAALAGLALALAHSSRGLSQELSTAADGAKNDSQWRGLHIMSPGRDGLPLLKRAIAEKLAPMGINALIVEVNYDFAFRLHRELSGGDNALRVEDARSLAETCRKHKIRLIPMLNCLGHQSWEGTTFALLTTHPELDESPDVPADNKGIYCRSWCPLHPDINKTVVPLIDELIDAFGADAIHVGMDEVFLIAHSSCSRCKGKDPAELFAKSVNDLHKHIVDERKLTMLMWADRLLDDKKFDYGEWEASKNGTAPAIDMIPKDIIMCDWHYEKRSDGYPSVVYLQEKGFRMLPATWRNKDAALAMMREARTKATPRMLGHLCTTWVGAKEFCRALLDDRPPENAEPKADTKANPKRQRGAEDIVAALKACMAELTRVEATPK
jgi:Glycosyl hydrolase family 20, catalytic domain